MLFMYSTPLTTERVLFDWWIKKYKKEKNVTNWRKEIEKED